ncbi:hypothetical protein ACQPXM_32300 [Kribbella sp. CA-253562]|uniref:hypothetical protein n=1 Tax=Kribbella sp. CA-253562 TaxID=3239942 RepID=UPI003D8CFBD7
MAADKSAGEGRMGGKDYVIADGVVDFASTAGSSFEQGLVEQLILRDQPFGRQLGYGHFPGSWQ